MAGAGAPLLYEVAARPWLARLSARRGRRVTLGDVPDENLEGLAERGFDYLWPMGVWRTGDEAARIAREQPWLQERWREAVPDSDVPEIVGSPFAVAEYVVDEQLGAGLRHGSSIRLEPAQAWPGNPTHEAFAARLWVRPGGALHVAVVNLGATQGQCRLPVPLPRLAGRTVVLEDRLGEGRYERRLDELRSPGLYLDVPAHGFHLLAVRG